MYAIIEDGGKQYKVQPGEVVFLELRQLAEGATEEITFEKVLFYKDDATAEVGTPLLAGAKVVGKIKGQASGPKLYPLQFKRRKDSQRRIGHRQKYLEVEITDILR